MSIESLASIFFDFKTYPLERYGETSPARVFQKMFPDNHYGRDLEVFLHAQNYAPEQRGADLPWWGKKFFTKEKGLRVMIVAQDSLVRDAGSIALYAQLMPLIETKDEFQTYANQVGSKRSFFNSWLIVKRQLQEWNVSYDFLYITDTKKVYKKGSWKDMDFDTEKSKALLNTEINICQPDLIILLGGSPLRLLDENKKYASAFTEKGPVIIDGRKCIIAPFFIGQGRTQCGFKEKLQIASDLIKKELETRRL